MAMTPAEIRHVPLHRALFGYRRADIDDLLDPFEMGRERTAVALAGALGGSPACLVPGMLGFSQRRLDFFQRKLELIRIELL